MEDLPISAQRPEELSPSFLLLKRAEIACFEKFETLVAPEVCPKPLPFADKEFSRCKFREYGAQFVRGQCVSRHQIVILLYLGRKPASEVIRSGMTRDCMKVQRPFLGDGQNAETEGSHGPGPIEGFELIPVFGFNEDEVSMADKIKNPA